MLSGDFPSVSVAGNPPADAGDMGSVPGLGGFHIPLGSQAHAAQLLKLCSGDGELQLTGVCAV